MNTLIICPSVLVSGVSTSGSEAFVKVCEPWLWWRGKPSAQQSWSKRWNKENWIRVLSTRTLYGSHGITFEAEWISSQEVSHVSRLQYAAVAKPPKTNDISGRTSKTESNLFDQQQSSSKTSMGSQQQSPPDITRFSTMSSATWKEWVTEQRQDASQRQKSARLTKEEDGSSSDSMQQWPTPTPIHATRGNHDEPLEKYKKRVRDYEEGKAKGKPGKSLGVAINWPTATARDWKWPYREIRRKDGKMRGDLLPDAVNIDFQQAQGKDRISGNIQGLLNPAWVESLMGFPSEWTDLGHWGTPSSPKLPH